MEEDEGKAWSRDYRGKTAKYEDQTCKEKSVIRRGWVGQNTTVFIIMLTATCSGHCGPSSGHKMYKATCSGHCGPSSGHKMYKAGELYSVYSLVEAYILNFQRDLVVF